ncbi:MAG: site-specific tyrosine recombinase/integron integrase, partial [Promethearchaeota archaeon]
MDLDAYIEDFLLSKEIEDGCSQNTIKAYKYDLELFKKALPPNIEIGRITQTHIRIFLKTLKQRNYTKVGIARKIACLKSFFKFLEQSEVISKNPMRTIHSPRIKREESLPKFLTLEEIKELLNFLNPNNLKRTNIHNTQGESFPNSHSRGQMNRDNNGAKRPLKGAASKNERGKNKNKNKNNNDFLKTIPYSVRSRAYIIIRLLYASMARVSEIVGVKIGDIDFNSGFIKLRGKGNKERIVPIDRETLEIIKDYLSNRITYTSNDPLLINSFGRPLSVRLIQHDIHIIKKALGLSPEKKLTPHVFRHTGATHLRQAGMDISELQDILGHSSPNTTRIYAKNDITKIKQV